MAGSRTDQSDERVAVADERAAVADERVAVAMVSLNGRRRIAAALERLTALAEQPLIIVVDNGSTDGTGDDVRRRFPQVEVIDAGTNLGAAGLNLAVAAAGRPYVALADDDSWYEPGALRAAADLFDANPSLGLIDAHTLVGESRTPDPIHADMVDTPVADDPQLPGHRIMSFLQGVSIVRARAYLEAGGFDKRLLIGGPEEHLAAELLCRGWDLRYVPEVVARHVPDHGRQSPLARRLGLRNSLWFVWLRRPWRRALRWSVHVIGASPKDGVTVRGVLEAIRGLPWILRERRPLPAAVERQWALLDEQRRTSPARRYR
jgi:GT2 family glycosyltransferase